jgi:hypothetical protein
MTAGKYHPACLLAGVDGEDPADCTTHSHQGDPGAATIVGYAIALLREFLADRTEPGTSIVALDTLLDLAAGRAGVPAAARAVTWVHGQLGDLDKPRALVGVDEILHHQVTVPMPALLGAAGDEYGDPDEHPEILTEWLEDYHPGDKLRGLLGPRLPGLRDDATVVITGVTPVPPGLQVNHVYDLECGHEWDHPFGGFPPGHHVDCSQHGLTPIAGRQ